MKPEEVKLVIWDLDNTLWDGVLAEGEVSLHEGRADLVRKLVDRGIMNSISSKNHLEEASDKLREFGLYDLFIFPQISLNAKGGAVKRILEYAAFRPQNTLFVDDERINREEVEYYNPGIRAVEPEFMDMADLLSRPELRGKNDESHSRLQQYKNLEKRKEFELKSVSNEDFLRQSNIRISISDDCTLEKERLFELVSRTNQLNYTKKRPSREEFFEELLSGTYETHYVKAEDRFGDYGIVGFYALSTDKILRHFLFSCRVLGLGIDDYIYQKIGKPALDNGSYLANTRVVDWIKEFDSDEKGVNNIIHHDTRNTILMVGGCDLEGMSFYLGEGNWAVEKEFSTVKEGIPYKRSYSSQLLASIKNTYEEKKFLCDHIPFYDMELTYGTKMFQKGFRVIIWSLVDDYICCTYSNPTGEHENISIGNYFDENNENALNERYGKDRLQWFWNNYICDGSRDEREFYDDVSEIIAHSDESTIIILVNAPDIDVSDWVGRDRILKNREMNQVIDKIVGEHNRIYLLDMRTIVKERCDLSQNDNRHFTRKVYYQMASQIKDMIEKI